MEMMKKILEETGWSQEQLANRLGVSFASVNAWLNSKSKPRGSTIKKIEKIYLAKETDGGEKPVYITIVKAADYLQVGDTVLLEKWDDNEYDDEAIMAVSAEDFEDADYESDEWVDMHMHDTMYVANSVRTVARGTYSAGRIYDKLKGKGVAGIEFILNGSAIARVIDWGEEQ